MLMRKVALVRTELRFSHPVEPLLRLQHLALLSAGVDDAVVRHLVGPELRFGHSLKPLLRLVHLALLSAGVDDAAVRHLVRTELRFSHPVEPLLCLLHLALLSAGVDDAVVRDLVGKVYTLLRYARRPGHPLQGVQGAGDGRRMRLIAPSSALSGAGCLHEQDLLCLSQSSLS